MIFADCQDALGGGRNAGGRHARRDSWGSFFGAEGRSYSSDGSEALDMYDPEEMLTYDLNASEIDAQERYWHRTGGRQLFRARRRRRWVREVREGSDAASFRLETDYSY